METADDTLIFRVDEEMRDLVPLLSTASSSTSGGVPTTVRLLDGREIAINIQPRLYGDELAAIVASHCQLKPPDIRLFGLYAVDENGDHHWLSFEKQKRVLEQDLGQRKDGQLYLYHKIKYFVDTPLSLKHLSTIEPYFLQLKEMFTEGLLLMKETAMIDATAALLVIYVAGHELSESNIDDCLRRLDIPAKGFTSKTRKFIDNFETKTLARCQQMGFNRAAAILSFIDLCCKSATYGMRLFSVIDRNEIRCRLGVASRGLYHFDVTDALLPQYSTKPKLIYRWSQLENLYYKERKFTLEVHDSAKGIAAKSATTAVLRTHNYTCTSSLACKSLWTYAIAQHTFYLEAHSNAPITRKTGCIEELTAALDKHLQQRNSTSSLNSQQSSASSLHDLPFNKNLHQQKRTVDMQSASSSASTLSLPSLRSAVSQEERKRDMQLYKSLKVRKQQLEASLIAKYASLKEACVAEAELSGVLPMEIHLALAPGEQLPKCRRRVGTSFTIDSDILQRHNRKMSTIEQLMANIEINRKIVSAAQRLAQDKSMNKSVRKSRERQWEMALNKQKELESQLAYMKHAESQPDLTMHSVETSTSMSNQQQFRKPRNIKNTVRGTKLLKSLMGSNQQVSPIKSVQMVAQSAPTTPRGSNADLRHDFTLTTAPSFHCDFEDRWRAQSSDRATNNNNEKCQVGSSIYPPPEAGSASILDYRNLAASQPDNLSQMRSVNESIGYVSNKRLQSSYRRNNFPTLVANTKPPLPTSKIPEEYHMPVTLHDNTDVTASPTRHYCVSEQRISQTYYHNECLTSPVSPQLLPINRLSSATNSSSSLSTVSVGSLDRRLMKARQRLITERHSPQQEGFVSSHCNPHVVEVTKPLKTADLIRYRQISSTNQSLPPLSPRRPTTNQLSPLIGRMPRAIILESPTKATVV